jgi:hypothetical protein
MAEYSWRREEDRFLLVRKQRDNVSMQASPFWRRFFLCAKTAWNFILLAVQSTKQNQQNVTKTNSKPRLSLSLSLFLLNRSQFHPAHKSSPKKMISLTADRSLPKHTKKRKKRKTKRRTRPIESSRGSKTKTEVQKAEDCWLQRKRKQERNTTAESPDHAT